MYMDLEELKPPNSYAGLIRLTILTSPGQRTTLADISKCLMKVARSRHDPCY